MVPDDHLGRGPQTLLKGWVVAHWMAERFWVPGAELVTVSGKEKKPWEAQVSHCW